MVITLDELIRFLRINSARSESDVGLTTFGLLMIHFAKRLKEHEKKDLEQLGTKYLLDSDDLSYDVNDQSIHLEQDGLVFENRRYDIEKLITFLNEVNIISPISGVAVGIAFNFRQTS